MEDLKSSKSSKSSIYNEESINELIQNLSEHLKFKSTNNVSSKCNNLSSLNQDKTHSPYCSPNNSLSSTASDLINQQQNSVGMGTYFLMEHLLKNGNLIKEAVRRLKFSNNNQQIPTDSNTNQSNHTRLM